MPSSGLPMNVAIGTVSRRLALAADGADRFVGYSAAGRQGRAFGGNVAAQALLAAGACVPEARFPHSLHAYFVRPAPAEQPLDYVVTRLRDGGAFSVRRVDAIAGDGVCLTMTCSFVTSVTSTEHQRPAPSAPPPEAVPRVETLFPGAHPESYRGVEVRAIEPKAVHAAEPGPPRQRFWIRTEEPLPADPLLRAGALTYLS